jgi:hypothetical protein
VWDGLSHEGSVAEVRKSAVHKCVYDLPEIEEKPVIRDHEVGNPSPVDWRTLPARRGSLGAGQTGNKGERSESLIQTQVKPEGTTATSDVDSKKRKYGTIAHSPPIDTNTNGTVT